MKRFRFSLRLFFVATAILAVLWWSTKEGIKQKFVVETIIAQGGTAVGDKQVLFASGDSIVHHSLHPLTGVYLKCSALHPVGSQLEGLKGIRELKLLRIQPLTTSDSGLTDAAACVLLKSKIILQSLVVEGATCSNATMRRVRERISQTRRVYLKRHHSCSHDVVKQRRDSHAGRHDIPTRLGRAETSCRER